jgi:hypothetical protein
MAVALVLAALSVGGCASVPRDLVAGGSIEPGGWSAWAHQGPNEYRTCLEIIAVSREVDRLCDLEASDTVSGPIRFFVLVAPPGAVRTTSSRSMPPEPS